MSDRSPSAVAETMDPLAEQRNVSSPHKMRLPLFKLLDIGAGTNEVRRMLIGRELIGA